MNFSHASYYHGLGDQPLIGKTITEYIEDIALAYPEKMAIVSRHQKLRLTYRDLVEKSENLAKELIANGIGKGDRVGIWSTNNYEWFVIFLAASKIGAILVNVNPSYQLKELKYALNQSGTKLLFSLQKNRNINYFEMLKELAPHAFDTAYDVSQSDCQMLEKIIWMSDEVEKQFVTFDHFLQSGESIDSRVFNEKVPDVQIDDPVNIQYTSGTTGYPKGVTLSHHNIVNNAYYAASAMKIDENSKFCVPMPFYHCGGLISSAFATLVVGGCVVIPSAYFIDDQTLIAIDQESCTHISGVPTMFIAQLAREDFDKYNLKSLKSGFMAGAPCPIELMKEVATRMHAEDIVILYGLTESSPLMTATTVEDSLEIRATTVGRAISHVEIKIIDTETGAIVKRGEQGEICCRGHLVMLGYWNNEEATDLAIDDGRWLHSGDLGIMSADGYINITGRIKDMILRGGENVYPKEIEEVLYEHEDILQAQVFGIPDKKFGEEIALWVILKKSADTEPDDIRDWLSKRVSHFKIPKYIKIVEHYPMTVSGKIRKFKMREAMVEELNLSKAAHIQTA